MANSNSCGQNYDTKSPQGKLFITIIMALAEFERERTFERNKDATLTGRNEDCGTAAFVAG